MSNRSTACAVDGCERPSMALAGPYCKPHWRRLRRTGNLSADVPIGSGPHSAPFDEQYIKAGPDDCWEWQGAISHGYGNYYAPELKRAIGAHRYAYWRATGESTDRTHHVDHICHNPICVNIKHLRRVTAKQNQENRAGPNANNTSGYRGVSRKHSGWRGAVKHQRKQHFTRVYGTPEEAAEAVADLRQRLFTHSPA